VHKLPEERNRTVAVASALDGEGLVFKGRL